MLQGPFYEGRISLARVVFEGVWLVPNTYSENRIAEQKTMLPVPKGEGVVEPIRVGVL